MKQSSVYAARHWSFTPVTVPCFILLSLLVGTTASPRTTSRQPSFQYAVVSLPGQIVRESIVTKIPETVDITLARIPESRLTESICAGYLWLATDLDQGLAVTWHESSVSNPAKTLELEHDVQIPPQAPGVYEIRFVASDRVAVQCLTVGTLGIIGSLHPGESLLAAIDLRNLRPRSDVAFEVLDGSGRRSFRSDSEGIVRFPFANAEKGNVIARASDGSLAVVRLLVSGTEAVSGFLETDRRLYKPGDRIGYRLTTRLPGHGLGPILLQGPETMDDLERVPLTGLVNGGYLKLDESAPPGIYRLSVWSEGGVGWASFWVTDAKRSRYEIEAAPITESVNEGELAKFLVSARFRDGKPASALRLRYASNSAAMGESFPLAWRLKDTFGGALVTGDVETAADGDAVISIATKRVDPNQSDLELFIYDPDTDEVVATARARTLQPMGIITAWLPFGEIGPGCFPLVVSMTDAAGDPAPNELVTIDIRPFRPDEKPTPLVTDLTMSAGSYAMMRWCPEALKDAWYSVHITKPSEAQRRYGHGGSTYPWGVIVRSSPTAIQYHPLLFVGSAQQELAPGTEGNLIATSMMDGSALVRYGSSTMYNAKFVTFVNGMARFEIVPPGIEDDFKVTVDQIAKFGSSATTAEIRVRPQTHSLHVDLTCLKREYHRGESLQPCVRVRDSSNKLVESKAFGSIIPASPVAVVRAKIDGNALYATTYRPVAPNGALWASWAGVLASDETKSYLYPTPTPMPQPTPTTVPGVRQKNAATVVHDDVSLWYRDLIVPADKPAHLKLAWPPTNRISNYLLHVIAVTNDGKVGEAYASVKYDPKDRP